MKKFIPLLFLLLIGLIPLLDLFHPGLPITHDGQDHVARIANFYQNLKEGNLIPRWAENLNWGYGHPILMFLYPLPSYIASLFHFLGFSLVDSTKIVFGLGFLASGFAMYAWLKTFLSKEASLAGGILYMFAPYRFVDLYVRGALGEATAFVFLPLSLYFLAKEKNNKKISIGLALSVAFLITSHNAISLMFLPIILGYVVLLNRNLKNLITPLLSILLGFTLSAFFWIPAFFEGKYTLRDIVTAGDYLSRFVNWKDLLYGNWSYGISGQFSVQIGIVHWILVVLSVPLCFYLYKKKKEWLLSFVLIIAFLLSIFLMLPSSNFIWQVVKTLQKFQFPWRLLSISVFSSAALGGIVLNNFKNKKFSLTIITILILFLYSSFWHAKGYLYKNEDFFTGIYNSTTDTGESSPIWSIRFMEQRPKAKIEVISGNAELFFGKRTSTEHDYRIYAKSRARIRENTLYFPGWEVLVDGKSTNIQFQDEKNRGLITFYVSEGKHNVEVKFKETKLRLFSDFLSLFSILLLPILWKNKQFR